MPSPIQKSNRSKKFARRPFLSNFNSYLVVPIDITVVGQDFHVAGNHKTAQSFDDKVYGRLTAVIKPDMLEVEVLRVIGGDKSAWAAIESLGTATTRYASPNLYAVIRLDNPWHKDLVFNSHGKIAQIKECPDTGHIHAHVEDHESKTKEGK